jgi:serine protease DegQ
MAGLLRLPRNEGVVLKGVQRPSPASKAGLEPGDVMLSINGQPVVNSKAMLNLISQLPPGTDAKVRVVRGNRELDVQVAVGERPLPRIRN